MTNEAILVDRPVETEFVVQWHLTNKCDRLCGHCYISHEEKISDSKNVLSTEEVFNVIDQVRDAADKLHVGGENKL